MIRTIEELQKGVAQFDDYTEPATVIENNLLRLVRELSAKLRERENSLKGLELSFKKFEANDYTSPLILKYIKILRTTINATSPNKDD